MKYTTRTLMLLLAALLTVSVATAKNIDLSTVPDRESVQLTIYNSEDITLVRERRVVSFKKGVNPLQFSWAGTRIDPSSVELRFPENAEQLEVLDTTFPHDKPQMLYWNVGSEMDGRAVIEISYFTAGITWSADYNVITDPEETRADVTGFVRVFNRSGEDYEDAQVRLVVGTINLVEKIAQLANKPMNEVAEMEESRRRGLKSQAMRESLARPRATFAAGAMMADAAEPKEVVKEGLSEYFIYIIEGTETVPHGWSKRLRSFDGQAVPLDIKYRFRPQQYGNQLVKLYILNNTEEDKLGTTPMPDGVYRIFKQAGDDGLRYTAQQRLKYVAIGDEIELNLGADPDVIFELEQVKAARENFIFKVHGINVYRRLDQRGVVIEPRDDVAGWDDAAKYRQRVFNTNDRPIEIEVRRRFNGDVTFRSGLDAKLHDVHTVQYTATIPAATDTDLTYTVVTAQGKNAEQNRVELEQEKE